MSDEVFELLNKQLGYPATCPHGNPIPGNARAQTDRDAVPLATVREGEGVTIVRIAEYAENVSEPLEYLGARGLIPGAKLTVTEIAPLNGPLSLKLGNRIIPVSREVAQFVWVKRAR